MQHLLRANYGSPLHLRSSSGMQVSTTSYAGDSSLPLHEHDDAYLCLVAEGHYTQQASGRDADCRKGMLLVHPQGHRHANRFSAQGARCLSIFLSSDLSAGEGMRRLLGDHHVLQLPDAMRLLTRIETELAATDDAAALALQSAVFELVAQACRHDQGTQRPPWLKRVMERLHDDPLAALSLQELAALAGVHPSHLARRFQQAQGVSVGEYQRGLRVELAREALADRNRSIADVAAAAGFTDQSHFARVFKRINGETPSDFRHKLQNAS
ncbi:helix-turn-helix transcriptional regulator [Dyella tabacisoli]|uniref:AraC family transcriptional regulator n=1 Tax=Dyella tabacisoli TaxID=2282381 RepID=A0A369UM32_9GAMM|nr:AraC family transcriptional regulator [Dyella tabacisoli]RDD80768.1 AraC family transcriptional regulator [Dyella tabacisoli]